MINLIKKLFTKPPVIKYKIHKEILTIPILKRTLVINTVDGKSFKIKQTTEISHVGSTGYSLITGEEVNHPSDYAKGNVEFCRIEGAYFNDLFLYTNRGDIPHYEFYYNGAKIRVNAQSVCSIEKFDAVETGKTHTLTKTTIIPV